MIETYFTDLVDCIRDECRIPSARILWNTQMMRIDGGGYGGWSIIVTAKRPGYSVVDGEVVAYTREQDEVLYDFDGNHGRPLTPGRWVISALMEADLSRHWSARRADEDDIREGRVALKQKMRKDTAKELAQDNDAYNAFRKAANDLGYVSPMKEELVEMERRAMLNLESKEKDDLRERKQARMHDPQTNLHAGERIRYVDINAPMGTV